MAIDFSPLRQQQGMQTDWKSVNEGISSMAGALPTAEEAFTKTNRNYFSNMTKQLLGDFEKQADGSYSWKNLSTNDIFQMEKGDRALMDYNNHLKQNPNFNKWDRKGLIDPGMFSMQYSRQLQSSGMTMADKILQMAADPNIDSEMLKRTFATSGMTDFVNSSVVPLLRSGALSAEQGYSANAIEKVLDSSNVGQGADVDLNFYKTFGLGGEGEPGVGLFNYLSSQHPKKSLASAAAFGYGLYKGKDKLMSGAQSIGASARKLFGLDDKKTAGTKGKGTPKKTPVSKPKPGKPTKSGNILNRAKKFLTTPQTPVDFAVGTKNVDFKVDPAPKTPKKRGPKPYTPRAKYSRDIANDAIKLLEKGKDASKLSANQVRVLEGRSPKGATPTKYTGYNSGKKNSKDILNSVKNQFKNTKNVTSKGWKNVLKNMNKKDLGKLVKSGIKTSGGYMLADAATQGVLDAAGAGDKTKAVVNKGVQISAKTGAHNLIAQAIKDKGLPAIMKKVYKKGGTGLALRTLGKFSVGGVVGTSGIGTVITAAMWTWAAKDLIDIYNIIKD